MLSGIRILYVEDEDSIRMMTERILLKRGAAVTPARNGQEGLDAAQKIEFDVIISDIQMPEMTGTDMVRELRAQNINIPVIIVSAHNEQEHLSKLENLNVECILQKPINLKLLVDSILELTSKN